MAVVLPDPTVQVQFAQLLQSARVRVLQPALLATVSELGVEALDKELAEFVPAGVRTILASRGLRAELLFPVPCLLLRSPRLLGYYRLLLGYSQKVFYSSHTGLGRFIALEEDGKLPIACQAQVRELCEEMIRVAVVILDQVDSSTVSASLLHELSLLTLGAQFRGSVNNQIGEKGIRDVFGVLRRILMPHVTAETDKTLVIRNAAGREVTVAFSSDPDIVIREKLETAELRNVIAIEIKGGEDKANLHNRMGEAEKSHQKARASGFVECWTILNVAKFDVDKLRRETPSTNRFFRLTDLVAGQGPEFRDFCSRVCSLTGIPDAGSRRQRRRKGERV